MADLTLCLQPVAEISASLGLPLVTKGASQGAEPTPGWEVFVRSQVEEGGPQFILFA